MLCLFKFMVEKEIIIRTSSAEKFARFKKKEIMHTWKSRDAFQYVYKNYYWYPCGSGG